MGKDKPGTDSWRASDSHWICFNQPSSPWKMDELKKTDFNFSFFYGAVPIALLQWRRWHQHRLGGWVSPRELETKGELWLLPAALLWVSPEKAPGAQRACASSQSPNAGEREAAPKEHGRRWNSLLSQNPNVILIWAHYTYKKGSGVPELVRNLVRKIRTCV